MNEHTLVAFARHAVAAISRNGTRTPSRRDVARALVGLTLGGVWGSSLGSGDAEAKKKRKKRKKKKKQQQQPPPQGSCAIGQQPCGNSCISTDECCGGCSGGKTCQGGACACPSGQHDCQGTCIPTSRCCSDVNCRAGEFCVEGTCVIGQGTCNFGDDICTDAAHTCSESGSGGECYCYTSMSDATRCGSAGTLDGQPCSNDFQCEVLYPDIPGAFCAKNTGPRCVQDDGICVGPCA